MRTWPPSQEREVQRQINRLAEPPYDRAIGHASPLPSQRQVRAAAVARSKVFTEEARERAELRTREDPPRPSSPPGPPRSAPSPRRHQSPPRHHAPPPEADRSSLVARSFYVDQLLRPDSPTKFGDPSRTFWAMQEEKLQNMERRRMEREVVEKADRGGGGMKRSHSQGALGGERRIVRSGTRGTESCSGRAVRIV